MPGLGPGFQRRAAKRDVGRLCVNDGSKQKQVWREWLYSFFSRPCAPMRHPSTAATDGNQCTIKSCFAKQNRGRRQEPTLYSRTTVTHSWSPHAPCAHPYHPRPRIPKHLSGRHTPVMLWGPPGVGKSQMVAQVAAPARSADDRYPAVADGADRPAWHPRFATAPWSSGAIPGDAAGPRAPWVRRRPVPRRNHLGGAHGLSRGVSADSRPPAR